jgi:hypothetical protein
MLLALLIVALIIASVVLGGDVGRAASLSNEQSTDGSLQLGYSPADHFPILWLRAADSLPAPPATLSARGSGTSK